MKYKLPQFIIMTVKYTSYAFILQVIFMMQLMANDTMAQYKSVRNTEIKVKLENSSINDVFDTIEEKTGYKFYYKKSDLKKNVKIDLREGTYKVSDILLKISKKADLKFRQVNNNIAVSEKSKIGKDDEALKIIIEDGDATVQGKITDETGEGLAGVNVVIKGTTQGTITDVDGAYNLDVPEGATLIFSFIGMATQEVEVGSRSVIDLVMRLDAKNLSEVVVTAMGISKDRASLGYAVQQVEREDLENIAQTNIMDAINGKISGVQITSSGGEAGSGASMIIRGYSNMAQSNQPLYVVDGVPINNESWGGGFTPGPGLLTSTPNRAIDINPDDVESISVLKGGAAAALYGIRAGNGVVLITTKSGAGKQKGLNVEYGYSHSTEKVNKYLDQTSSYSRGNKGAYSNITNWNWGPHYDSNPTFPGEAGDGTTIIKYLNGEHDVDVSGLPIPQFKDNFKNFFQDGFTKKHNVSISGNSDTGSMYASFSNLEQEGVVPNNTYGRTSTLIRADHKVTDKLKISAKANFINTTSHKFSGRTGPMQGLVGFHNMWDINSGDHIDENGASGYYSNSVAHPKWVVTQEGEGGKVNRLIGSVGLTYDIADWLALSYQIGLDTYSSREKAFRPTGSVNAFRGLGDISDVRLNSEDLNSTLLLRGNSDINKDLNVSYTVGNTINTRESDRIWVYGVEVLIPGLEDITNTADQYISRYSSNYRLVGAFGEVNFGYKNFLYLGVTGRNDWSSTLPKGKNSLFYSSVSLGFVFSELVDMPWLSFGKLRASYSEVAADAPVQSLKTTFSKASFDVRGQPGYFLNDQQNNPDLRPVNTKEFEIGADLAFLDNRLALDVAYFSKRSIDQIISVPLSGTTGFTSRVANLGEIKNTGIEATLTVNNPVRVAGLNWSTSFNFTKIKGEVVAIGTADDGVDNVIQAISPWAKADLRAAEGEAYGAIYGIKYTRHENGQVLIDANGYPIPDLERSLIGNINPDWILGINNHMEYKGINFNFTFEIKKGGDIINTTEAVGSYYGKAQSTENRFYAADDPYSHATKVFDGVDSDGNTNTIAAPLTQSFFQSNYWTSAENLVQDASWLRLRNVSIGYNFPESILSKLPIQSFNITFTGRNLWFDTSYSGVDPETNSYGVSLPGFDVLQTPGTKSYMVSLRVKF